MTETNDTDPILSVLTYVTTHASLIALTTLFTMTAHAMCILLLLDPLSLDDCFTCKQTNKHK